VHLLFDGQFRSRITALAVPAGRSKRNSNLALVTSSEFFLFLTLLFSRKQRRFSIPLITIKTGLILPDGQEELLIEYFCDHPGCPNIATQVLGCVAGLCLVAVACDEHAPKSGY
jgi:hypothetical protein